MYNFCELLKNKSEIFKYIFKKKDKKEQPLTGACKNDDDG
jgi:hypothetical protein